MTESLLPPHSGFVPYDILYFTGAEAQRCPGPRAARPAVRLTRTPPFAYIAASRAGPVPFDPFFPG